MREPKKGELPKDYRERLYKEWVELNNPSIGERQAYMDGFGDGKEVWRHWNEFFEKKRIKAKR